MQRVCSAPLRQRDSVQAPEKWAALTDVAGSATLGLLLASLQSGADRSAFESEYGAAAQLFDWSVWQNCAAELGPVLRIPGLFTGDLLQQLEAVLPGYTSPFPTLFAAPRGTGSGLHIDVGETHFWMSCVHGRKRWRLVGPADTPELCPHSILELNPRFLRSLDELARDSIGQYPRSVPVFEGELNAGELIFVPAGWAHEVCNLDHAVAVSANFVDASNLERARKALDARGLVCRGALTMSLVMQSSRFTRVAQEVEYEWKAMADQLPVQSKDFMDWKAQWDIFLSPADAASLAQSVARDHTS